MRALELLIEDYERRLKTISESMERNRSNGSIVHQRREERLNTKASEYRTFIAELTRAMAAGTSDSTCNLQNVSNRRELLLAFAQELQEIGLTHYDDVEKITDIYMGKQKLL